MKCDPAAIEELCRRPGAKVGGMGLKGPAFLDGLEDMSPTMGLIPDHVAGPGKMILELPCHPPSLNSLMRGKIRDRIRLGKAFRRVVAAHWRGPAATGKRAVWVTIVLGKGDRACDPDAYFKAIGDSLKKCGAIRDDNRHGVVWMPVEYVKGKATGTVIELEDLA